MHTIGLFPLLAIKKKPPPNRLGIHQTHNPGIMGTERIVQGIWLSKNLGAVFKCFFFVSTITFVSPDTRLLLHR